MLYIFYAITIGLWIALRLEETLPPEKRSKLEVVAQDVTFLGGGQGAGESTAPSSSASKPAAKQDDVVIEDIDDAPINLDDIPF